MVQPGRELGSLLSVVCALTLAGMILYMVTRAEREERWPMFVAIVLTLFSCVFFSFFEQAGSSITLFTDRNVDRTVLGLSVPASVFSASINPAFVLLFAPFFIWLWSKLGRYEPSTPLKFGLGVIQLGLGFGALWLGAVESQQTGMVPLFWLVLGYLLHTTGELCVSPVGLSMITKLSPAKIVGVMMGGWFLASSAAQYAAALIAQLTDVSDVKEVAGTVPPTATVMVYGSVFGVIALTALVTGALMCAVAPLLARRMGGVR
jgi:POT family proton-dependent oligopeptide transporter